MAYEDVELGVKQEPAALRTMTGNYWCFGIPSIDYEKVSLSN